MKQPAAAQPALLRARSMVAWIAQIALAVVVLKADVDKLSGAKPMVALFEAIGAGQWLRSATSIAEIAGVVLLLVPGYAAAGAAWLALNLLLAVGLHLFILHSPPTIPLALLTVSALIVWLRADQITALGARSN